MACAAGYATLEVIEEEKLLQNVNTVGAFMMKRLEKMKASHKIIGDVRGKGLLLAIDLVKDKDSNEPFIEAGKMVYIEAFKRGLAWIPAGKHFEVGTPSYND